MSAFPMAGQSYPKAGLRGRGEAGGPALVLFDNLPIGIGEIIVSDSDRTLGLRIIDPDYRAKFDLSPRRQDFLGEFLPVAVVVGSLPFGLEVSRVLSPFPGIRESRASGNLADPVLRAQARPYDFRRPDKLSRVQLEKLAAIHELAARTLALRFRGSGLGGLCRARAGQSMRREAEAAFTEAGLTPLLVAEQGGAARRSGLIGKQPAVPVYEAPGCPRPFSPRTRDFIERMNSELGMLRRRPLSAWVAGELPGKEALLQEGGAAFLACLSGGWRDVADFPLAAASGPEAWDSVPGDDMVLSLELQDGEGRPLAGLLYSVPLFEPYLSILGSR